MTFEDENWKSLSTAEVSVPPLPVAPGPKRGGGEEGLEKIRQKKAHITSSAELSNDLHPTYVC